MIPDFASLAPEVLGPVNWRHDVPWLTRAEASAKTEGGCDIVAYDRATGDRHVVISASQLQPSNADVPLSIDGFAWSRDGSRLLIFANAQRVWRQKTRGDYWVFNTANGELRRIGVSDGDAQAMHGALSPDDLHVAFVYRNDLYIETTVDGLRTRLTIDGSPTCLNGAADWAYEEEFSLRSAFAFSPDSSLIAYLQFDVSAVGECAILHDTGAPYPEIGRFRYPKAGTANARVRLGIVSAAGGATRWVCFPDAQEDWYLPRLDWVPDGTAVIVQRLDRAQQTNDVWLVDAETCEPRRILRESSSTWLEIVDRFRWVDDGARFLWLSERDGWRHLYSISRAGECLQLTHGAFDVISVAGIDGSSREAGQAYVIASPGEPTRRYLYRAPLDGKGTFDRVTPQLSGTHAYEIAPDGVSALHTYSTFECPPTVQLVQLPAHDLVRILVDNTPLMQQITEEIAPLPTTTFFSIDVGDAGVLDGWEMRPANFRSDARYPLVIYVYGEPASTTVVDRWSGGVRLWHQYLCTLGYVVASVDNRGTAAPKGRAWRKTIYGSVGKLSPDDQAAFVRSLLATRSYLDPARVGIWGHSGGGSNTLHALFRHPELYAVGIALAPVPDQRLYDTIYQERYMRTPQANPAGYLAGSPIHYAQGLRGKLLLIHGTADDNCHLQGSERLIDRLITLGKQFDVMIYPGRTHALDEGDATTNHLCALKTRYLTDNLPAGAR